ncbi:phosphoadenosine phosphosulfate reductase domain-containing protein [Pseudomonas yamanorum]
MNHYRLRGKTVVSFSGGRTSAYMLRQVLDSNTDLDDLVITFANTGKEHPATLEFVRECAERWAVPIVWLEFRDDDAGFSVVDYATASRQGEPFEALILKRKYLPNPVTRFCTIDLKIRIIHKYLRSLGLSTEEAPVDMMTGIRADEAMAAQSFPKNTQRPDNHRLTMHMTGNAVPPLAGQRIIEALMTSAQPFHPKL